MVAVCWNVFGLLGKQLEKSYNGEWEVTDFIGTS
jgi:hypothetical protein